MTSLAALGREPAATPASTRKLTVVQNSPIWLERTQAWLYQQVVALPPQVETHVAAERLRNADEFPLGNLHVLRERGALPFVYEKALGRLGIRRHGHVYDVIRRSGADVLHSHFGLAAWAARGAAERAGVPHIATFYGFDVTRLPREDPAWKARYRDLFSSVGARSL